MALYIIVYEVIILLGGRILFNLFKGEFSFLLDAITFYFEKIGAKWLFMITISTHLSIGFFCIINFSYTLKETKKPLKFFILNIIKCLLYYFLSIIIIKVVIERNLFDAFIEEINKLDNISQNTKSEILEVVDNLKRLTIRYISNLLSNYNNGLDKLIFGILYITLFSSPKFIKKENILYFRFSIIIPIIYIILGLIIRALYNLGKIDLSIYISAILVGPKFSIFGFFIATLLYIKINKYKYKMFD